MGQKKITDLQLRDEVTEDLSFPSDDTIQSYRVTAAQIAEFIFPDGSVDENKLNKTALTGQTADATPDVTADYLLTYDASADALKKILMNKLFDKTLISGQTEDTAPDEAADFILTYDASATSLKKALPKNIINSASIKNLVVNVLSEDTAPDVEADSVLTYDNSATSMKKAKLNRMFKGSYNVKRAVSFNNAGTPNTQLDMNCDSVILMDSNYNLVVRNSPGSITNNVSTSGPAANGRDQSGAFSSSSWIHFYWIWNGTTLATVSSATAPPTGPVLPTGYTHWAYQCSVYFDSSSHLKAVHQYGNTVFYDARQSLLSNGTSTVEASITISAFIPSIASAYTVFGYFYFTALTSTTDITANLRWVTGINGQLFSIRGNTSAFQYQQMQVRIPNTGNLYYINSTSTDTPGFDVHAMSYEVPCGA